MGVWIIEVSCSGKTVRARRRGCDSCTSCSGSLSRMHQPRIARRAGVVTGTHDDLCIGMTLANCGGDRPGVTGIEGNGDCVTGGGVNVAPVAWPSATQTTGPALPIRKYRAAMRPPFRNRLVPPAPMNCRLCSVPDASRIGTTKAPLTLRRPWEGQHLCVPGRGAHRPPAVRRSRCVQQAPGQQLGAGLLHPCVGQDS